MTTEEEIAHLRKRNSDLHRRCQKAESAVADFVKQWDAHGGPQGGSFGRALLASECVRLRGIIARNAQCRLDPAQSHVTIKDIEASLEILYAEQKEKKP